MGGNYSLRLVLISMLVLLGLSSAIFSLTIDTDESSEMDESIERRINFDSYYSTSIDLNKPFSIAYMSYGNPQLNPNSPLNEINQLTESNNVSDSELSIVSNSVLFYPNPFSLKLDSPQLGFKTTKDVDENILTLQLFDMRGLQVFEGTLTDKIIGNTYTKIPFSDSSFNTPIPALSSGVYIYLVLFEDTVLSKGKFVIKP